MIHLKDELTDDIMVNLIEMARAAYNPQTNYIEIDENLPILNQIREIAESKVGEPLRYYKSHMFFVQNNKKVSRSF